ncbi:hypothetical protein ABID73_003663, partial [Pantoea agglomerans]
VLSRGGVYYAFLLQSQPLSQKFFSGGAVSCASQPVIPLPVFRVDGGAL